jgi:CheY-like chemotaxis protein
MKSMLSQLLSLAAPDIRTTLNTIQGTLSIVGDQLSGTEEQTLVQHANLSTQHLISLLQTVGDLDSIENQLMQVSNLPVDLGRLIESVVDSVVLDPRSSGVSVLVSYDDDLDVASIAEFVVDEEKFSQSFTHVLQYAVLFSRRDRVDIQVSKNRQGRLGIQILDTSLGLAQSELDNLFSFNQWSSGALNWSMSNGVELNLNICLARALMRLIGGEIHATSEIGSGIRWLIELPLDAKVAEQFDLIPNRGITLNTLSDQAASDALHAYATSAAIAEPEITNVLLVDDSPSNRLVLKSILTAAGYAVDLAADGLEALSAVRQKSYAAILMDLAMPNMDGITAAKEIRNLPGMLARVPLIALTAYVSDADQQACLDAGFNDFLSKPVKDKDLTVALKRVLGGGRAEATLEATLEATMPVERLTEFSKIIGVVEVFKLLERFSTELRSRSRLLENIHLGNLAEVRHNLYMLVCSADNFGFSRLALAAKNLSTKLSENQLQFFSNLASREVEASEGGFWANELMDLDIEISHALTFLSKYVGESIEIEPFAAAKAGFKNDQDTPGVNHV